MRKTAFTAITPVLQLPVKRLLQTASLFFLAFLFASLGQFFVPPVAYEQGNTTSSNAALQLNREGQFLPSLAHTQLCMMEKRMKKGKENSLKHSRDGRSERSCLWAAMSYWAICSPWPSSERSASSQLEGETTLTPSPPEAGLTHCWRQLISQEHCFL